MIFPAALRRVQAALKKVVVILFVEEKHLGHFVFTGRTWRNCTQCCKLWKAASCNGIGSSVWVQSCAKWSYSMLWRDAEDTCFVMIVMFDRMIPKGGVKTPRQFKEFADGMQCTLLHERICSVESCTMLYHLTWNCPGIDCRHFCSIPGFDLDRCGPCSIRLFVFGYTWEEIWGANALQMQKQSNLSRFLVHLCKHTRAEFGYVIILSSTPLIRNYSTLSIYIYSLYLSAASGEVQEVES